MTTDRPAWVYDELRQTGLDFEDAAQVADYDRNQGTDSGRDRALIERLGMTEGHTVIDFGAGTGGFALAPARRCRRVHAVDVSHAMLDFGQARAGAAGLDNIEFHHGGFLTYVDQAEPADFIITRYALHHLPDFWKIAALSRLAAMLAEAGVFYLEDVVFSFEPAEYRSGVEAWIAAVAKPAGEGFTEEDFATHLHEEFSTYGWIMEGMLTRAGFRIDAAEYSDRAYAAYLCTKAPPVARGQEP